MKKIVVFVMALACLGAANAQGRVEVGGGIGAMGNSSGVLPSAQVVVHAPDVMGPMGLRGTVGVNMVWMYPAPNVTAGLTYPVYREAGGLQSYVYGGAGTYFGNGVYGDLGVEVSHPVGRNLRMTGDFGAMVVGSVVTPKGSVGLKTSF